MRALTPALHSKRLQTGLPRLEGELRKLNRHGFWQKRYFAVREPLALCQRGCVCGVLELVLKIGDGAARLQCTPVPPRVSIAYVCIAICSCIMPS